MDAPSRGNYDPESGEHYFHRDKRDFYDEDDKHKKRRSQTLPLALKWTVVVCLGWGIVMMTLGLSGVGTGGTQAGSVSTLTPGSRLVEQGLEKQKPKELQRREHRSKQEGEGGKSAARAFVAAASRVRTAIRIRAPNPKRRGSSTPAGYG